MKLFLTILVTTVVAGALVGGAVWKMRGGDADGDTTAVRIETVARGELAELVSAPGVVEPKVKVSISAKLAARVIALPFDEGQTVTKGDPHAKPPVPPSVLVELDAKDLEAQLRAAEARYAAQAAQLTVAKSRIAAQEAQIGASRIMFADAERDLNRQRDLLKSKDVSQALYDTAQAKADQLRATLDSTLRGLEADKANLDVMKHELEAADAEIARARDMLSYTTITSPIDGVVTRVNAEVGELVVTGTMNTPAP